MLFWDVMELLLDTVGLEMEANFASERAMKAEPNFYRLQCKY
jgi:hypothetical protein